MDRELGPAGGNFSKKSSAGSLEKASFMTDSTSLVTSSLIWGLTSLMINWLFLLMNSLTVSAKAGSFPSNRFSSLTFALRMSKSMFVLRMLSFWFPTRQYHKTFFACNWWLPPMYQPRDHVEYRSRYGSLCEVNVILLWRKQCVLGSVWPDWAIYWT